MTPRDKRGVDSTSGSSQHIDAGHTEVVPSTVSDHQPNNKLTEREQLEQLALAYHKSENGEGEYGCPGVECPGVQRLTRFAELCAQVGHTEEFSASDIFLRHDLPLAVLFLSLGVFGAWLGSNDRDVYRWLGYGLILVATLGVGSVARGWL